MTHPYENAERAAEWIKYWTGIFAANPNTSNAAAASICPVEPGSDERIATEDSEFVARCRAEVYSMSGGSVSWEDQLLTRSPRWGLIWRADFWPCQPSGKKYPSRVACWRTDDGRCGTTISGLQHDKLKLRS